MTKEDITKLVNKLRAEKGAQVLVKGNRDKAPKSLSFNDSRRSYTPDIVVVNQKRQDYYALEKKITSKDLPDLIGKWILFAIHARLNSGNFYLVVANEKDGKRCQAIIDSKQLAAKLIVI